MILMILTALASYSKLYVSLKMVSYYLNPVLPLLEHGPLCKHPSVEPPRSLLTFYHNLRNNI